MKLQLNKQGGMVQVINDRDIEALKSMSDGIYSVELKDMSTRTSKQNAAIHVMYAQTAQALNDAGISMNRILNRKLEEKIQKAFSWGIKKLSVVPKADIVLEKMQDMILEKIATELPWTDQLVKDALWRPLQVHLTEKKSTTQLTKDEIDKVYELYNSVLAKHGVHIAFPSRELWES